MNFITLFLIGITLLLIETFLPGFVVLGALGIILIVISWFKTIFAIKFGIIIILIEIVIVSFLVKIAINKSKNKLTLKTLKQNKEETISIIIGQVGITKTTLRPVGKALFENNLENNLIEVISNTDYIEKNTKVKCIKISENKIYVEKLEEV